jgi:hypothetical protein
VYIIGSSWPRSRQTHCNAIPPPVNPSIRRASAAPPRARHGYKSPGTHHGGRNGQGMTAAPADTTSHQNRIVIPVMRPSEAPSMSNDRGPAATRAIARQPFAVTIASRLASIPGTWDKDDHGREGMPRNRYPPRPLTPRPRLRSYVSESALKKNPTPAFIRLAGYR